MYLEHENLSFKNKLDTIWERCRYLGQCEESFAVNLKYEVIC